MIHDSYKKELFAEYCEYIEKEPAKQAYMYLIGWAATLRDYVCYPGSHGAVSDIRFFRGENQDFAFIPNKKWLLFYFRSSALRLSKYNLSSIKTIFPDAKVVKADAINTKIKNLEDAIKLAKFIES